MENRIFSVTQINSYIKAQFELNEYLQNVCVCGEISNFKLYPSGHCYFSLKDENSSLKCVMFRGYAASLRFQPENGLKVIAVGSVRVYPRDGAYQLYCELMTPSGAGDLFLAFEQLKAKLSAEGLFDPTHKKPLPKYPGTIALITSGSGAAVHDMIRIIHKRFPITAIVLIPVRVQGSEAPGEMIRALQLANRHALADLIILGRGGGSAEDLNAFNNEDLARAVFASQIPVISAVGHEPDVSITDYVADVRAATPSNGAEIATPDCAELFQKIDELRQTLYRAANDNIHSYRNRLNVQLAAQAFQAPEVLYSEKSLQLDTLKREMNRVVQGNLEKCRSSLKELFSLLDAYNPALILQRGYAYAEDPSGNIIISVSQVKEDSIIRLRLSDGVLDVRVIKKEMEESI